MLTCNHWATQDLLQLTTLDLAGNLLTGSLPTWDNLTQVCCFRCLDDILCLVEQSEGVVLPSRPSHGLSCLCVGGVFIT